MTAHLLRSMTTGLSKSTNLGQFGCGTSWELLHLLRLLREKFKLSGVCRECAHMDKRTSITHLDVRDEVVRAFSDHSKAHRLLGYSAQVRNAIAIPWSGVHVFAHRV
jgi:hypothetical protein